MSLRGTWRTSGLVAFALAGWVAFGCSDEDDGNRISAGGSSGSAAAGGSSAGSSGAGAVGGSTSSGGTGGGSTGGSSGTGGGGTGGTGATGSGVACPGLPLPEETPVDGGTTDGGTTDGGGTCVGSASEAEALDLDMYIMMDRSVSMTETLPGGTQTRWDGVRDAVEAFVSDPRAATLGVGIQFFGQSGVADPAIDCDVSRYANPAVEIADLATNGPAILQAVQGTNPGGQTPTAPALEGALRHAKDWAGNNFGKGTIVVLVTDGFPTQCSPISVSQIATLARDAFETEPRIRTFVIGLAADLNLDAIARAGGTGEAFLIGQGDVRQQFLDAMLNFTEGNIVCEFEIPEAPEGQVVDFNKVQVVYSPAVGGKEEVPKVENVTQCGSSTAGGWYYDNNTNPGRILVCPCTCSRFAAGRVDVRLGCEPRRPPVG